MTYVKAEQILEEEALKDFAKMPLDKDRKEMALRAMNRYTKEQNAELLKELKDTLHWIYEAKLQMNKKLKQRIISIKQVIKDIE